MRILGSVAARLMMAVIAAIAAGVSSVAAAPKLTGAFIGPGTYSPDDGCRKLAAIQSGSLMPNIANYPDILTREGFFSWEGGCSFLAVRKLKSSVWVARMYCAEGSEENKVTNTFVKLKGDRFRITEDGVGQTYKRCKRAKGK